MYCAMLCVECGLLHSPNPGPLTLKIPYLPHTPVGLSILCRLPLDAFFNPALGSFQVIDADLHTVRLFPQLALHTHGKIGV